MTNLIMVIGSRDWHGAEPVRQELLHTAGDLQPRTVQLVHDNAAGAPNLAAAVAAEIGWQEVVFRRNVRVWGSAASDRTFEAMTDYLIEMDAYIVEVLAFIAHPDDTTTPLRVHQCENYRLPVRVIRPVPGGVS